MFSRHRKLDFYKIVSFINPPSSRTANGAIYRVTGYYLFFIVFLLTYFWELNESFWDIEVGGVKSFVVFFMNHCSSSTCLFKFLYNFIPFDLLLYWRVLEQWSQRKQESWMLVVWWIYGLMSIQTGRVASNLTATISPASKVHSHWARRRAAHAQRSYHSLRTSFYHCWHKKHGYYFQVTDHY